MKIYVITTHEGWGENTHNVLVTTSKKTVLEVLAERRDRLDSTEVWENGIKIKGEGEEI